MQIKIYADLLFLINFLMDFLLFALCALLLRTPLKMRRLFCAALFGAFSASVIFFLPLHAIFAFAGKILLSALMLLICFGKSSFRIFCKRLSVLYLCTFALGGLCFALMRATPIVSVRQNGILYCNLPIGFLLLAFLFFFFLARHAFRAVEKNQNRATQIISVTVHLGKESLSLPALYDSGNFVCDRYGRGAILGEWRDFSVFFPCADSPQHAAALYPRLFSELSCHSVAGSCTLYTFYAQLESSEEGTQTRTIALSEEIFDPEGRYHLILPNDWKGDFSYDVSTGTKSFLHRKNTIPPASTISRKD